MTTFGQVWKKICKFVKKTYCFAIIQGADDKLGQFLSQVIK